jgi:hypothetical protein
LDSFLIKLVVKLGFKSEKDYSLKRGRERVNIRIEGAEEISNNYLDLMRTRIGVGGLPEKFG